MKWAEILFLILKLALKFFEFKTDPARAHQEAIDEIVRNYEKNKKDFFKEVDAENPDGVWGHLDELRSDKLRERLDKTSD
jgi:hypothetical protein